MDKRKLLDSGTVLPFAGMECTVESLAGRGSNVIAYWGSCPDRRQPATRRNVLIEELFPYHLQNAVYREESGSISWSGDARELVEVRRLNFYREKQIQNSQIGFMSQKRQTGSNSQVLENTELDMAVFPLNHTLYAVLELTGGRSLETEIARPEAANTALSVHIRRMCGILDSLEAFHRAGLLHLDISPDTIFLIGEGGKERVVLLNLNGFHTRPELEAGGLVYCRDKECYTAPEVRLGDVNNIGCAADLYAAAAVFYRCLTGKELSVLQTIQNRVPDVSGAGCLDGMPGTTGVMVRRILRRGLACLARKRYHNAAEMRRDLEELKERMDGIGPERENPIAK